jgi:arsenate reductase (glutaredoxin)
MSLRIYHNPRCKKSRAGLEYLISKTSDYERIDYLQKGISTDELRDMVLKLHIHPKELVRTNEDIYKKELKSKKFNEYEWIQILKENPKLLKRPVIVGKHKAVIGDPVSNIDKLFLPQTPYLTP